jgi:hypothetical protein
MSKNNNKIKIKTFWWKQKIKINIIMMKMK